MTVDNQLTLEVASGESGPSTIEGYVRVMFLKFFNCQTMALLGSKPTRRFLINY